METISELETLLISNTAYLEWFQAQNVWLETFNNITNCPYGTCELRGKTPLQQIMAKKNKTKHELQVTCMLVWFDHTHWNYYVKSHHLYLIFFLAVLHIH